ncbi:hypothetical protein FKW77_006790 [Venturia effusa]|uniref:rhamnogalacturonan endolyase n=1 Tax=Venturia effusa TaxID=50376 RepID=A0A517LLN5_9PEZI|nr:hypothetical protein FKW77_006790 [Venturia effusa]
MVQACLSTSLMMILALLLTSASRVVAVLNATESVVDFVLANDRLYAAVNKTSGAIYKLALDDQDLLGGSSGDSVHGVGPYLDCYCVPSGFYTPGYIAPRYELLKGSDSNNTPYGGLIMSETYPSTGQVLEQYWFLRDGETGLHTFSRLYYLNETTPFLRNLQEFRTLFRPNTPLWTNLSTNAELFAPLPSANATKKQVTVQDATWYLGNSTDDAYVIETADYFTKYTFADTWRDSDVHGMYADGTQSKDGSTFGAWLVMNTKDTYAGSLDFVLKALLTVSQWGGPIHSDLMVDGIVYNYIVSNHHGDGTPNIMNGFDRTFGPQYFHFNKGSSNTTLNELRKDAVQYADPSWNAAFYDSIAHLVPGYVPTSSRGTFKALVKLPSGTCDNPIAVLAQNGVDFQDNAQSITDYQYWADIDPKTGLVIIPRVKAGTYRLTIYADGVFGWYTQDDIVVKAGETVSVDVTWDAESAGTELWRIGTPDKSAGEFKHGYTPDPSHPNQIEEYRVYWGAYDFPTDFPEGVNFRVGESKESEDWNYIHWSVYGGYANYLHPVPTASSKIHDWTISFTLAQQDIRNKKTATLTIQLAGAKTAAGNTDIYNATQRYSNLPLTVTANGEELESWVIPYYQSSSCGARSGVVCYQLDHKFVFDIGLLAEGDNKFILSLPPNATDYESALLPPSVYVQYDALRLEVK